MKLKEALPQFRGTKKINKDNDSDTNIVWSKTPPPRKPLPPREPVRREDLEIDVVPIPGGYRATIKSVKGKPYGSKLSHPEEFMASGRTADAAKEELFKKLKI